jgi:hypothetical protein
VCIHRYMHAYIYDTHFPRNVSYLHKHLYNTFNYKFHACCNVLWIHCFMGKMETVIFFVVLNSDLKPARQALCSTVIFIDTLSSQLSYVSNS